MHACMPFDAQCSSGLSKSHIMADWSIMDREWLSDGTYDPFECGMNNFYQEFQDEQQPSGSHQHPSPMQHLTTPQQSFPQQMLSPELMDSTQQMMPQQMMSSQQLMSSEQLMTSQTTQFELMFPEEIMATQPMMPHQMSPQQLMSSYQSSLDQTMSSNQITAQEQMFSTQLLSPQQLLSPEQLMSQPQMPQSMMPQPMMPQLMPPAYPTPDYGASAPSVCRGDSPREIRNKAEKQRRDKLNHSISELASIVPPVVASNRKIDKTGVLRLTAHYLRAYQYVFGDSIWQSPREFSGSSAQALLSLLNGFLLTTTYRGLVVVVSQNIEQYLGFSELHLLGQSIFSYVHPDDIQIMQINLMPDIHLLGPSGELLLPEEMEGRRRIADKLASEKRRFMVRFKKLSQPSESTVYVPCYVEGSFRKSDRAARTPSRYCQVVRRARARGETPYSSGNDVVFIGIVRPTAETFVSERHIEAFRMEYRTRHSVDGEIMECEQRISLVVGYMTHEVNGVNAMHFMHRDDVRWVIFTLREMYDQHLQVGESCYRLMAKNGQFLYMRTRGILDIDERSKAVRSMVCTNTVVDEKEGKHLIRLMKQKCLMMINSRKSPTNDVQIDNINLDDEDQGDQTVDQTLPEQDLEKVILTLVTNLPSKSNCKILTPAKGICRLKEIDSSQKTRTLSAVALIYSLINHYRMMEDGEQGNMKRTKNKLAVPNPMPATRAQSPGRRTQLRLAEQNRRDADMKRQFEGLPIDGATPSPLSELFNRPPTPKKQRINREFKDTHSKQITTFGVKPDTVQTYLKESNATRLFNRLSLPPTNYGASTSTASVPATQLDSLDVYIEDQLRNPVLPNVSKLLNFEFPNCAEEPMELDIPLEVSEGEEAAATPLRPNFLPILPEYECPGAFFDPSMPYFQPEPDFQDPNPAFADPDAAFVNPAVFHQENAPADGSAPSHAPISLQNCGNVPNGAGERSNGRQNEKNNEFLI